MATPTEAPVTETATAEVAAKPTAAELINDTAKLSEVKLSKTDEATIKKLRELGLYTDEEIARLEAGMKVAKVQAAESKGERGERGITTIFSPVAANVFRARLIEDKSLDTIKNEYGTDLSDTNSKVREVSFKLMVVGLKAGTISKDWVEEQLKTLNTGKERERKAKDAVVGGADASNGAEAPSANASAAIDEPAAAGAEEENPFASDDLNSIEQGE